MKTPISLQALLGRHVSQASQTSWTAPALLRAAKPVQRASASSPLARSLHTRFASPAACPKQSPVRGARSLHTSYRSPSEVLKRITRQGSRRSYQGAAASLPGLNQQQKYTQYGITAGVIVAGATALQMFMNREQRDSLSPVEAKHLNATFQYLGAGLAVVVATAVGLHKSGTTYRLMALNPLVFAGVSLVGSIGSMMLIHRIPAEETGKKHLAWLAFNGFQAMTLAPLAFLQPAILFKAGLYTAGVIGSLSYVGATAKNDTYLMMGGPLLAGLTVVALSSLAPLVLPATAIRTVSIAQNISLYGGLAVFGGMTLYDVQKILAHGRMAAAGQIQADPMADSIGIQLDTINIFIRIVQLLMMQQNRRK
ncbi:uncharacterized protein L969DRAFT_92227 [Mixia osmundae IAM 14324]|uniref:Uncharacterized protein n=1 Tax=Mixia osmundae (strain CBS 9802 / IAM 14324 / JCM 22182 / KY 12970) TaxID=764103 RepID=G7DTL3_MIXOS|nr:uncharacterized protein L969DRAFT_92227 [Mixia osmundae IAM 14324]KEI42803.1 hypothetical protein L969DRAFT_92227 [Mixia osmundae IAM 14324]GAA93860.1 hypothetical protein E5Q_00506 [Mixia osmundae IAM 14324]